MAVRRPPTDSFDISLRQCVYRQLIREERAPTVGEMADALACSIRQVHAALKRLSQTHAFMVQENGELWRVAPFSAIPTAFPVRIGRKSWYGNCIWDALGIPAMLQKDAKIHAACGCCNYAMPLEVRNGKLLQNTGMIHIAVPAREWYKDVVFT
jgi:alkylmercury lyase-like protein